MNRPTPTEELRRRAENAEARLEAAQKALVATEYFTTDQVGDDIAPRIHELWSYAQPYIPEPGWEAFCYQRGAQVVTAQQGEQGIVVFTGGQGRFLRDDASVTEAGVYTAVERSIVVARLRAWAEAIEKDGEHDA